MFEDDFDVELQDVVDDEEQMDDLVEYLNGHTRDPGGIESQLIEAVNRGIHWV
jgi:hypothetical protein